MSLVKKICIMIYMYVLSVCYLKALDIQQIQFMYAKHCICQACFCHDNPATIFGASQEATDYYVYLMYICTGIVI